MQKERQKIKIGKEMKILVSEEKEWIELVEEIHGLRWGIWHKIIGFREKTKQSLFQALEKQCTLNQ